MQIMDQSESDTWIKVIFRLFIANLNQVTNTRNIEKSPACFFDFWPKAVWKSGILIFNMTETR